MFVYMAIVDPSIKSAKLEKVSPIMAVSRFPLRRIEELNKRCSHNPPTAAKGAPHWMPFLVIGPFMEKGANYFLERWQTQSRTAPRRAVFGVKLCRAFNRRYDLQLNVFCGLPEKLNSWTEELDTAIQSPELSSASDSSSSSSSSSGHARDLDLDFD